MENQQEPEVRYVYVTQPVTTQSTGKKWKAMQAIGALMLCVGVLGAFLLGSETATSDGAMTASALAALGLPVGLVVWLVGRIAGWWYHG